MKRLALVFLVLASLSFAAVQKRKERNPIQIQVMEAVVERAKGSITLDGRIKNTGEKRLEKLVLLFDLLDTDRKTISRRRGPVDEAVLEPGQESSFHFYVADHARAIEIRVQAESGGGREVNVVDPGPFLIE